MAEGEAPGRGERRTLLVVLLASLLCFALPWDRSGFDETDELFYLVGGLTAHETGDFLLPSYHGHVRLQKPPLNYWLVAASYRLFGVDQWQGRLPSVLAGVASIGLTYWLGLLLFGTRRSGLYAACALLSCHLFLDEAHLAATDVVAALLVLGAICGFAASLQRGSRLGLALAWVTTGAAMLQKGPVALIPLLTAAAWQFLEGRRTGSTWRQVISPVPVLLCCALVLPWPILVLVRLSEGQVVPTVTKELGVHLLHNPLDWPAGLFSAFWRVSVGSLPWSVLAWHYRRNEARSPAVTLLALWGVAGPLLFGLLLVKERSRYFVPFLPAIALLCGHALARLQARKAEGAPHWRLFVRCVDLCFPAAAAVSLSQIAAARMLVKNPESAAVAAAGLALSAGAFFVVRRLRRRAPFEPAWIVTAAVALAAVQVLLQFSWPATYVASPAYVLMKEQVRGLSAAASVGVMGLEPEERSWAWLGAGRSLPEREPGVQGGGSTPAADAAGDQFLLLSADRAAGLPAETRSRYGEVASMSGPAMELRPTWFLNRPASLEKWARPRRTLVLLRRHS